MMDSQRMREATTSVTLLDGLRASDPKAWTRTSDLYRPLVLHWCRRGGVSEGDVDDVAQEVFRAISTGLEAFRKDRPGDTFRGWLRGLTRHKVLDWHRARGRRPVDAVGGTSAGIFLNSVAAIEETEDDDRSEVSELYHRALEMVRGEFEANTWSAFWRVTVEGHASADVAHDLGVSSAAVRQAKSRVLRRLKEEVGDLID